MFAPLSPKFQQKKNKKDAEDEARRAALLRAQPSAPTRAQPSQAASKNVCRESCKGKEFECNSRNNDRLLWHGAKAMFLSEDCWSSHHSCIEKCGISP